MRSNTRNPQQLSLNLPDGYDMFARRMTQALQELGQPPDGGQTQRTPTTGRSRPMPGLMGTWRRERR